MEVTAKAKDASLKAWALTAFADVVWPVYHGVIRVTVRNGKPTLVKIEGETVKLD